MPTIPDQFFTASNLVTYAGATGATFTLTNTVQRAFGLNPAWLGLAVAQGICLSCAWSAAESASDWIVAGLNGCLIYLAAGGATSAAASAVQKKAEGPLTRGISLVPAENRSFVRAWF
jgi:hypothetical protein